LIRLLPDWVIAWPGWSAPPRRAGAWEQPAEAAQPVEAWEAARLVQHAQHERREGLADAGDGSQLYTDGARFLDRWGVAAG
jgi:hypothetical protein